MLINSHLLSEIELTCDEIAILRHGKVIQQGPVAELTRTHDRVRFRVEALTDPVRAAVETLGTLKTLPEGDLEVRLLNGQAAPEVAAVIVGAGGRLTALETQRESLEDLFVRVVEEE